MAQITITTIDLDDDLSLYRPITNDNMKILRDAINELETYLDTTTKELAIRKVTIERGANPVTANLLINEGSFINNGNVRIDGDLQVISNSNTISLETTVNIDGGNLTLVDSSGDTRSFINEGKNVLQSTVYETLNEAIIASDPLNATIDPAGKNLIFLNWAAYTGGAGFENERMTISAGVEGQTIDLVISGWPGGGVPLPGAGDASHIEFVNTDLDALHAVQFTKKYDFIKMRFLGGIWIPISHSGVVA
jgi:hypothetical protein